jgi:peptidoglycan/LPS O-acetylase OafA/YrhL
MIQMPDTSQSKYGFSAIDRSILDALRILRVLATLAVVLGHSAGIFGGLSYTQWPQYPYIQSSAVVLFFCVSGATIAWILTSRNQSFGRFIFDRCMRLVVPLIPAMGLASLVDYCVMGVSSPYYATFTPFHFFANLTFMQGMLPLRIATFGSMRQLWTLSIEFWVYVFFGGLLFAMRPTGSNKIFAFLASVLASVLLGSHIFGSPGFGLPIIWLLGAGSYILIRLIPPLQKTVYLLFLLPSFLFVIFALRNPIYYPENGEYSGIYNMIIFCFFFMVMLFLSKITIPSILNRLFDFLSCFCYTAYLTHHTILVAAWYLGLMPHGTLTALIFTFVCFFFAWVISIPFEARYKIYRDYTRNVLKMALVHMRKEGKKSP